jgi:hypothetical protein
MNHTLKAGRMRNEGRIQRESVGKNMRHVDVKTLEKVLKA